MATALAQKLQMKTGQRLRVLNAPQGYPDLLAKELPEITVATTRSGSTDAVLLFVNSLAEVERLAPTAIAAIKSTGLLWMAYPKGTSMVKTDVNRDRLWAAIKPLGWLAIRQVALDDTWSAMRFRPAELVGK
jgi:hypothetical protein